MKNIDDFIDQVIKDAGLDTETPEVVEQIKSDLSDSLENRINSMIVTNIPAEKLEEFDAIMDSNDEEKIQAFLQHTVPDFEQKVAIELAQFRASYLA
jgi:ATP phosphoribosyltransferase